MRTMILMSAGVSLAFALTYFAVLPRTPVPAAPAKALTLSEIQRRRDAHREATAASAPVVVPTKVTSRAASDEPVGRFADAKEQLNRSMVGLPFAMSESVTENCNRFGHGCDDVKKVLERMAAEPRDPDWAPRMERFILKWIEVEEGGALRIRALECRHDWCALETASEAQAGIQKSWPLGTNDLYPTSRTYGVEHDLATGIVTYVSVRTWSRREVFLADHRD